MKNKFIVQTETTFAIDQAAAGRLASYLFDSIGHDGWSIYEYPCVSNTNSLGNIKPYSDANLACACNRQAFSRINGVNNYSFCLENRDLGFLVEISRIKIAKNRLSEFLHFRGMSLNGVTLTCKDNRLKVSDYYDFLKASVKILNAFYGRVFDGTKAVKRTSGCYKTFGGLPGLHVANYFGPPIADKLDMERVKNISLAEVSEFNNGYLVCFPGRTDEFSRLELEALQPLFGDSVFRKIDGLSSSAKQEWFFTWWLRERKRNNEYMKDKAIFDFDLSAIVED